MELQRQSPHALALKGDTKYIRYEDGSTELFKLQEDPQETRNLSALKAYQNIADEFAAELDSLPSTWRAGHPNWQL